MCSYPNVVVPSPSEFEFFEGMPCPVPNCSSVFKTWSNRQMHLVQHHNKAKTLRRNDETQQYACPIKYCKYSLNSNRYFAKFKQVKQHYLKCHGDKKYACTMCEKSFASPTYLSQHAKSCGKQFVCSCGWSYNSRETLITHCKRKSHTLPEDGGNGKEKMEENTLLQLRIAPSSTKSPRKPSTDFTVFPTHYVAAIALSELSTTLIIPKNTHIGVQTIETKLKKTKSLDKKRKNTQETQTADCKKPKISTETQTNRVRRQRDVSYRAVETQTLDLMPFLSSVRNESFDHDNSLSNSSINNDSVKPVNQNLDLFGREVKMERLCNNETQTDLDSLFLGDTEGTSSTETQTTQDLYSNMCTQTCSDASDLFDFSFADIETQTAWPNL